MRDASRPSRLALLLLVLVQLACVRGRGDFFDHPDEYELYRRRARPQPRIPGAIAATREHVANIAPMRLTARDGTGLALRSLQVRGLIDEPLSHTELHLTFENPHDETLDGQFEILLPSGAEVSRFALMVGGEWIESEVVEREQARQIYQDHKHTRRDPALLERERGRRFAGRIFPIAPRERKQIILSYAITHDQPGASYRVPLAGLPRVDELDVEVVVREHGPRGVAEHVIERHGEHEAPTQDFELRLDGPALLGIGVGEQALLRVVPIPARDDQTAASERPEGLSVLVDSSASMAGSEPAVEQVLEALLAALDQAGLGELPLELWAFDQTRERVYAGTVAGADARVLEALRRRPRLGASDLGAALDAVGEGFDRVVCVCDGELTAGATERFELEGALGRAFDRGVRRLDAIVLDEDANLDMLEWLVSPAPFDAGEVFDAHRTPPRAWIDALLADPAGPIQIAIPGAKQVWPAELSDLRPGQAVLVHASFARAAPKQVSVEFGGAVRGSARVELRAGEDDLARRAIAVMRVKALIDALASGTTSATRLATRREIVELSTRYHILGDHTAMLALDSEQAYASYGIERSTAGVANSVVLEAASLPVGNAASRDWTAVVDIAPMTSRDGAGIRLAGTTSAESAYVLEGSAITSGRRRSAPRRWLARAHGRRIGSVPTAIHARAEALETQLDEAMLRCARHVASTGQWIVPRGYELRLGLDASGRLLAVRDTAGVYGELRDCVIQQLHELAGDGWAAADDERPAHQLRRRYRIVASIGSGDAPEGWRLHGVAAFVRALELEAGSGTDGWAKFIEEDLADGLVDEALDVAWTWHLARPDDLLPYVSLGRALLASGRREDAARAYGSLIDLHPSRAESRRFAGALLESLDVGGSEGSQTSPELELAIDSYRKARALHPDHPTGYQALAWALARHGQLHEAVGVLVDALGRNYTNGRFGDAIELLREDLATLSAAAILADPDSRPMILASLVDTMVIPSAKTRDQLLLTWESDASSLALRVFGGSVDDAYTSTPVRNGYGPQGFGWPAQLDEPLGVSVRADELGPEALALGSVRRMHFEEGGSLRFETRPFVIWPGQAGVELGNFERLPRERGGTERAADARERRVAPR